MPTSPVLLPDPCLLARCCLFCCHSVSLFLLLLFMVTYHLFAPTSIHLSLEPLDVSFLLRPFSPFTPLYSLPFFTHFIFYSMLGTFFAFFINFLLYLFLCFFPSFLFQSSAPELNTLWNPSLRKTLSHPSAVHKDKEFFKSKLIPSSLGSTNSSKSVRVPNKAKEKNKPGSAPPAAEYPSETTTERRKSPLAGGAGLASSGLNHASERNLVSPSKLTKKSFIDGFKNSLKMKRTDFLSELQPSSSSLSNSSHSFDAATIKKSSLTNDYLTRMNSSIRRWSESTPRQTKNNES